MKKKIELKNNKYVLSIAFADYKKAKSGMPKVVLSHQEMFNKKGISYIYIYALKKTIKSDNSFLFFRFGVIIDGEYSCVLNVKELVRLIDKLKQKSVECIGVHIHHLLYMRLKDVFGVVDAMDNLPIYVFLHDYYLCCTNYTLLKNASFFCGKGGLNTNHCSDCRYYSQSIKMQSILHKYLAKYGDRIKYVSPSYITSSIYSDFHPEAEGKVLVIPHQVPVGHNMDNMDIVDENSLLTIGFLGFPAKHKGWESFYKLSQRYKGKYRFVIFNSLEKEYDGIEHVNVSVSSQHPNAMTDALKEKKVDVSVLWAQTPETYSYTCMEAYAANTFIITCKGSGNIEHFVNKEKNGLVLNNDNELFSLFSDEKDVKKLVNEYRKASLGGPVEWKDNDAVCDLIADKKLTESSERVYIEYARQDVLSCVVECIYKAWLNN